MGKKVPVKPKKATRSPLRTTWQTPGIVNAKRGWQQSADREKGGEVKVVAVLLEKRPFWGFPGVLMGKGGEGRGG